MVLQGTSVAHLAKMLLPQVRIGCSFPSAPQVLCCCIWVNFGQTYWSFLAQGHCLRMQDNWRYIEDILIVRSEKFDSVFIQFFHDTLMKPCQGAGPLADSPATHITVYSENSLTHTWTHIWDTMQIHWSKLRVPSRSEWMVQSIFQLRPRPQWSLWSMRGSACRATNALWDGHGLLGFATGTCFISK